jgi:hypothetical protein
LVLDNLGVIPAKALKDGLAKTEKGSLKLDSFDENFSVATEKRGNRLLEIEKADFSE